MPSYTGGDHGKDITCEKLFAGAEEHLRKVVSYREKYGHKWLAGESLMWIDFAFWEIVDYCVWLIGANALFEKFPSLRSYHSDFLAIPQIAEAWKDDKKTQKYPFNNAMALIGGRDSEIMPTH